MSDMNERKKPYYIDYSKSVENLRRNSLKKKDDELAIFPGANKAKEELKVTSVTYGKRINPKKRGKAVLEIIAIIASLSLAAYGIDKYVKFMEARNEFIMEYTDKQIEMYGIPDIDDWYDGMDYGIGNEPKSRGDR